MATGDIANVGVRDASGITALTVNTGINATALTSISVNFAVTAP